jgi:hypothetical protein
MPKATYSASRLNLWAFALGVSSIIVANKLVSYLTPFKLYFTFSWFLYGEKAAHKWEALTIKLLIPTLVGFLLFYVPYFFLRRIGAPERWLMSTYRYLRRDALVTAQAAGFFAAFVLAWPLIAYWDLLMAPELQDKKAVFFLVYPLYFAAYYYFAGLGVALATLTTRNQLPEHIFERERTRLGWIEATQHTFMGIATSALATYLASSLGSVGH